MSAQPTEAPKTNTVSLRQWIRLLVAYLLIPTVLLVCAGDLMWWPAWVYAGLVLVTGIGGRVWAEHKHPGLTAQRQSMENLQQAKSWDKVLAPLMALGVGFPMVIVAGLEHRFEGAPSFPLWVVIVGFLLVALGYAFAAWALAENRFFFSVVCIRTEQGHRVCDSGPYRVVRHPGYAGHVWALLGLVMALSSVWALIPALLVILITVLRTHLEDSTLHQELPGYPAYAQRVRYRLLPGVY
ncbi:methyltransferase family protein [Fluctibacter halophilus]|nr:isoprenylcysteine carboxylmethyltransferase family protein [Aestuariibacter halophilus]